VADTGDELHDDIVRLANAREGMWVAEKWQLEKVIGVGGTGAVYRAKHRNGSMVAIKVMHAEHLSNNKHTARFFREALYANRIEHEAVLKVFDDGVLQDGCPYLVTELLSGKNLDDVRQDAGGKLPLGEVIETGMYLLDVLEKAHQAGLIHRDLKPVNLFRTNDGKLKMLDFGLGRDLFEKKGSPHNLTSAFVAMGTVGFMAPEQAKGKQDLINATTDLWALGATLLALATGLDTHEADSPIEALGLAAVKPVQKTSERVRMPLVFCDFLDRAMAFEQKKRFASAAQMREALQFVRASAGDTTGRAVVLKGGTPQGNKLGDDSTLGITTQETDAPTLVQEAEKTWSNRTRRTMPMAIGAGSLVALLAAGTVGLKLRDDVTAPNTHATTALVSVENAAPEPPLLPLSVPTGATSDSSVPATAFPGSSSVPAPVTLARPLPSTPRIKPTFTTVHATASATAKRPNPLDKKD
jgi:eukaryotic-like serine/threonine-protein kinase